MIWVKRVLDALGAFFAALPGWFRRRYLWVLLVAPAVWGVVVYQLAARDVFGWGQSGRCKDLMEIVHPSLLAGGTVLGLVGYALKRNPSLMFMCVLCAFALSREIGGQGTSIILISGLVGLITYAHRRPEKLTTFHASRLGSSLVATAFISYAFTQVLDRGLFKRVGRLVTWDGSWDLAHASPIEESLEAFGGLCLLLAVLAMLLTRRAD